jgi:hypothetical protein
LLEALDMEGLTPQQLARWKDSLVRFIKAVTLRTGKGLVMKSPPHTGRLQLLAETFPQARFVHIVRDPYVIFPSTRKLWLSLDDIQGLQRPHERDLDEYIFTAFDRMYHGFESQRSAVDSGRLFEVRYEDLVQDPVGQLQLLYERLELGDFEPMRERLQQHLSGQSEYQTNQYDLDDALQREIRRRWSWFFERYGY